MARRWMMALGVALAAAPLVGSTARAGGWATVELDQPIGEVRAGQAIDVGFMVKQHGQTPIHQAFGQTVEATFNAKRMDSKGGLSVRATPDAPVGHFTARVTFPSEGRWSVEITPAPFAGTPLAQVTVLAASGSALSASASEEASISQAAPAATSAARTSGGRTRDAVIALTLAVAALATAGVMVFGRRRGLPA